MRILWRGPICPARLSAATTATWLPTAGALPAAATWILSSTGLLPAATTTEAGNDDWWQTRAWLSRCRLSDGHRFGSPWDADRRQSPPVDGQQPSAEHGCRSVFIIDAACTDLKP